MDECYPSKVLLDFPPSDRERSPPVSTRLLSAYPRAVADRLQFRLRADPGADDLDAVNTEFSCNGETEAWPRGFVAREADFGVRGGGLDNYFDIR